MKKTHHRYPKHKARMVAKKLKRSELITKTPPVKLKKHKRTREMERRKRQNG